MNPPHTPTDIIIHEAIRATTMKVTTLTLTTGAVQCRQQCQPGPQEQPRQATPSGQTVGLITDHPLLPDQSTPGVPTLGGTLRRPVDAPVGPVLLATTDPGCRTTTKHKSISGVPPSDCMISCHQVSPEDPAEPAPPGRAEPPLPLPRRIILITF